MCCKIGDNDDGKVIAVLMVMDGDHSGDGEWWSQWRMMDGDHSSMLTDGDDEGAQQTLKAQHSDALRRAVKWMTLDLIEWMNSNMMILVANMMNIEGLSNMMVHSFNMGGYPRNKRLLSLGARYFRQEQSKSVTEHVISKSISSATLRRRCELLLSFSNR